MWKYFDKITDTKYSDKTAKSGTKYEYAVRAYSSGGNSVLSSEKAIIYLAIPEFSVEATVKGVKITWEKVAGAESYKIYRKISDDSWKEYKTISASKTSLILYGRIFVLIPTAIPSAPCAKSKGNFTGSDTGSLLRPS